MMTEDEYTIIRSIGDLQSAHDFVSSSYIGLGSDKHKSIVRKMIVDLEKIIQDQHKRIEVTE